MSVSERRPLFAAALLFAFVALVSAGATAGETAQRKSASVDANSSNAQLVSTQRALRKFVAAHGATLGPISFDLRQTIGEDQTPSSHAIAGHRNDAVVSSCTASSKVSIPRGVDFSFAATAPTCAEGLDMISDAVKGHLDRAAEMK